MASERSALATHELDPTTFSSIYLQMPYQILKNNDGRYRVVNCETGRVHARDTTMENAKKQIRLLEAVDNNPGFRRRS